MKIATQSAEVSYKFLDFLFSTIIVDIIIKRVKSVQ